MNLGAAARFHQGNSLLPCALPLDNPIKYKVPCGSEITFLIAALLRECGAGG